MVLSTGLEVCITFCKAALGIAMLGKGLLKRRPARWLIESFDLESVRQVSQV